MTTYSSITNSKMESLRKSVNHLLSFCLLCHVFVSLHQRSPKNLADEKDHQQIAEYLGIGYSCIIMNSQGCRTINCLEFVQQIKGGLLVSHSVLGKWWLCV